MTQTKGIRVALFILCFSLALNIIGGLGMGEVVGHDVDTGLDGEEIQEREGISDPSGGEPSGDSGGFIDYASGAIDTVQSLSFLVGGTYQALKALDAPESIAVSVQIAVNVGFALGIASVIRGMNI